MTQQLHVISHTHWDFEWYFSTHESLIQLIYHLDEVMDALESGEVENYYLDGQLSIVEDYLQACPHQRERFTQLVEQKKLLIGPWYTQTDQLIIAGESIVRNLQLGIRLGNALGHCEMLGYVPDAFGQSIDMPKIYNGFGIDKTVFWRGLSHARYPYREGNWQSEDGSSVQFYNIKNGYYVGGQLIYADDAQSVVNQVAEGCLSHHIALPVGGDQRFVDRNIKQRIDQYNQQLAEKGINCQLIESRYSQLFEALNHHTGQAATAPAIEGEMIDGEVSKIHRSIYSSRADHKRMNDKLERRVTQELEPLMAMACQYGIDHKPALIDNIWRTLLRNHAHDSAGGCNTDKTNKIIVERYEQVDQMSASARDYLVRKLAESQTPLKAGSRITLFNTLSIAREQVQTLSLATKSEHFQLTTLDGQPVDYAIVNQTTAYNGSIQRNEADNDPNGYYTLSTVQMKHRIPAMGFTSIVLHEQTAPHPITPIAQQQPAVNNTAAIANHRYRISFAKGQLTLEDQLTGEHWHNFLTLIDGGDDGDTYDYSPPHDDWQLALGFAHAHCCIDTTSLSETLTLRGQWLLPRDLEMRAARRCDTVCEYSLTLTLTADNMPVTIECDFDNQVQDHRLQLVVNSPIETLRSNADTPFGHVSRPHYQAELTHWRELGWKEEPTGIYPMINYVNLSSSRASITLLTQGIKEYQVLNASSETQTSGTLALTLFRSVGWLGKPDLLRRPGIASGQQYKYIATPDSQMLGHQISQIGLDIAVQFEPARLGQLSQTWATTLPYYQAQSLNQFTNTLKYFVMHPLGEPIPDHSQLLETLCPSLICSSITLSGNTLLVRCYNPDTDTIESAGEITINPPVAEVSEVNLLNQVMGEITVDNQRLILGKFAPKQIRTFAITLA